MNARKPILLLAVVTALIACHKSGTTSKNCDDYWIAKKQKEWMSLSSCTPTFKHYLGKGIYRDTVLYYNDVGCINCDMMPPKYGLTCKGDTVRVADWGEVNDKKVLASCTDH